MTPRVLLRRLLTLGGFVAAVISLTLTVAGPAQAATAHQFSICSWGLNTKVYVGSAVVSNTAGGCSTVYYQAVSGGSNLTASFFYYVVTTPATSTSNGAGYYKYLGAQSFNTENGLTIGVSGTASAPYWWTI